MREIVLFMEDSWAERAHLGSAPLNISVVISLNFDFHSGEQYVPKSGITS